MVPGSNPTVSAFYFPYAHIAFHSNKKDLGIGFSFPYLCGKFNKKSSQIRYPWDIFTVCLLNDNNSSWNCDSWHGRWWFFGGFWQLLFFRLLSSRMLIRRSAVPEDYLQEGYVLKNVRSNYLCGTCLIKASLLPPAL